MKISVKAKPGAKLARVEKIGEREFMVAVKERAHEGQANEAIGKALAKHFGVVRSTVRLLSGVTSRKKVFEITTTSVRGIYDLYCL